MKNDYPKEVTVLGVKYKIEYVDNASEVDSEKRGSYFGQMDPWDKTIRVLKGKRSQNDIFHTIFHEVIHAIKTTLYLSTNEVEETEERDVDLLSLGMLDFCVSNKLNFHDFNKGYKKK